MNAENKMTVAELIKTYMEIKSIRKTSQLSGYSKSGVEYILKQNNILLFPRSRKGVENSAFKALDQLDSDDPRRLVRDVSFMHQIYVIDKLSIPQIAEKLGISNTTVITGLKQCQIKRRSKSEALIIFNQNKSGHLENE